VVHFSALPKNEPHSPFLRAKRAIESFAQNLMQRSINPISFMMKKQVQQGLLRLSCLVSLSLLLWTQAAQAQTTWTSRTSATDNNWNGITYGNGLFVATAWSGTGDRVMTSPDGITWTSRTSAANNRWIAVTYGNGMFVAVSWSGTSRVMTSPDGITWTTRTAAAANQWYNVTYGNGLFVAVAQSGVGNRVMTSPDGITWTSRTSAADNSWYSVAYGNSTFVAVANSGASNRVMTSPDGITWTSRTSAADNNWYSVTYGNGLFVAVANSNTGNGVMTSPDGITWTSRTSPNNTWRSVTYGNGKFVAVAQDGVGNRVMTSPDGITWTSQTSAADNSWFGVTYGNGLFVAIAESGTGNRVMTSPDAVLPVELLSFTGKHTEGGNLLTWATANEVNNKGFQIERAPQPPKGASPTWEAVGIVNAKGKAATYEFTDKAPFGGWGLYRLRQIDNDGKETLSKVISIAAVETRHALSLHPNPVSNTLTIEFDSPLWGLGAGNFQILNLLGQQVLSGKTPPSGSGGLDVSALPQGSYVLKVGTEQAKFIKQ
jgi:hypothetical protein